ncbi:hypothetical protein BDZ45DRAFT_675246 [Acephala macrosclerotiorum]|nr:hypothetical protein BDZ45DRAFT_675246 [Acephala macrosclerotiorum]
MLLSELNEDVLRIITSLVATGASKIDVLNLARTCRSMYIIVRPFIAVSVDALLPSPKYQLLKRTLDNDPSYGLEVRSLHIERLKGRYSSYPVRQPVMDPDETFAFLQQLPRLNVLRAEGSRPRVAWCLLSPDLTLRNSLQKLYLRDVRLTAIELIDIIALPELRHLDIGVSMSFKDDSILDIRHRPNLLQHLSLCGNEILLSTLSFITRNSPHLQTLIYRAPLHEPAFKDRGPGTYPAAGKLCPSLVLSALLPLSKTLTNLEIYANGQPISRRFEMSAHDGSRLDLSQFLALKSLTASADLFVAPLSSRIPRNGCYSLLPRSLKRFHLQFQYRIIVFSPPPTVYLPSKLIKYEDEKREEYLNEVYRLYPSYTWIIELAQYKVERGSDLESVKLHERKDEGWPRLYFDEKWEVPEDVRNVFEQAGIHLEMFLRGAHA